MTQLLIEQAQVELDQQASSTNNKLAYKINKSVAIGLMKDEFPKILFSIESIPEFTKRMIDLIKRFREPIRPARCFPRHKKHRLKFHITQRLVL